MSEIKALVKTAKTAFDIQMDHAEKESKRRKGVSFVICKGNSIEFAHIPTTPQQAFKYFYNPSQISEEERKKIILQRTMRIDLIEKQAIKALKKAEEVEYEL